MLPATESTAGGEGNEGILPFLQVTAEGISLERTEIIDLYRRLKVHTPSCRHF